jgi:hypothetical protein
MSLITPNKTANQTLLSWQDVANTNIVLGTPVDVSGKYSASILIKFARKTGTAFSTGWPNVRIEGSQKTSGNDAWGTLLQYQTALGVSIANTTLNGAVSAGATSFVVTASTNIAAGDILFLEDGSQANYETCRVKSVSGTTITPEEALTFSHQTAKIVTDQAEIYQPLIDLTGIVRVRAVCDNGNSGQTIAVQVLMTTHDSHTVT